MTGTSSAYKLSHEEQQAGKQRTLAALRVQRLKEVRAQDRAVAKARARAYQGLCVDSAAQLQAQLIALISEQRAQELAALRAAYEDAVAGLAAAQRQAAVTDAQLAAEAQLKRQLYEQRQAEAQARFGAALARVKHARQGELQAALAKARRRQQIMLTERDKAQAFREQAREAAAAAAQREADLNLQEEQRRRHNQVSRIDFRFSRLHELGVPHLVVNHSRGRTAAPGPEQQQQQACTDAATQAQLEADRCVHAFAGGEAALAP
jgi:hypothetical protein